MARQVIDLTTPQPNGKMGEPTKAAWEKTNDNFEELYNNVDGLSGNQTTQFITGFKMTWNASNNISVSEGAAYIPGLNKVVRLSSSASLSGITFAAASWGHIYLYESAGVGAVEYSTVAPTAAYSGGARTKTGDNTRRYLGSFRTIAANQIAQFYHNDTNGLVNYITDINNTFLRVLISGTSTTSAGVDCSACVPVSSRVMTAISENMPANTSAVAYISNSNNGPAGPTAILSFLRAGIMLNGAIALDGSQAFNYSRGVASTPGLAVWCTGYVLER